MEEGEYLFSSQKMDSRWSKRQKLRSVNVGLIDVLGELLNTKGVRRMSPEGTVKAMLRNHSNVTGIPLFCL